MTMPKLRQPTRATKGAREPGLLAQLGVVGIGQIEPVVIGALISGDPLLLIGGHGAGKSYLLERIAIALGLEWRHYNASLLNFDDLVGYPLPSASGGLSYIQTPASIWGAEAVFIDEISRCRPDIQNKLFPVIHERRVQGLLLEPLRYRWSAMNPPSGDDDDGPSYLGSEPLDLALADRFAFVVEMPAWSALTETERESLVLGSGAPIDRESAGRLMAAISTGQRYFDDVLQAQSANLAVYIRLVVDLLGVANMALSSRRAALLLRNVAAVHAARMVTDPAAVLGDSASIALSHSFPQPASGIRIDSVKVLACHKEAWRLAAVPADDPIRRVLSEPDPLKRVLLATRIPALKPRDFSSVVADALASLRPAGRHALAAALFESGAAGRLVAAIAEQCGGLYAAVCTPQEVHESVLARSERHKVWQAIESAIARRDPSSPDTVLLTNLLAALFNAKELATAGDVESAVGDWARIRDTVREFA